MKDLVLRQNKDQAIQWMEVKKKNRDLLLLEDYTAKLNDPVDTEKLQEHKFAKGVKYLPIGIMEMMMDELFFGLWKTENFRWNQVANEIVGCIDVSFYHPIANTWLTRQGAAAIQIMVDSFPDDQKHKKGSPEAMQQHKDKNAWALDLANKKPNGLSDLGGFAKLKADCFKNAALSIGKKFGRDVNREFYDDFRKWVKSIDANVESHRKQLEALLKTYDREDKKDIIEEIIHTENDGLNSPEFYKSIIDRIHGSNQPTEN